MTTQLSYPKFELYSGAIKALPEVSRITLLDDKFKLVEERDLVVYYAPFDYTNSEAKVTIIGITPGFQQMEIAFRVSQEGLLSNLPQSEILRNAKREASFAGQMRFNLCKMLDELLIPQLMGMSAASELFDEGFDLLNTMSVAKYPIFKNGENYGGNNPSIVSSELLRNQVLATFEHMDEFPISSLIIPLGVAVEKALRMVIDQHTAELPFVAWGFPHPSGQNGSRVLQFKKNFENLSEIVSLWSTSEAL